MDFMELILPLRYASYLINGDYSGYTKLDMEDMRSIEEEFGMCFDVNFDTVNFQTYKGTRCDVCEFIFIAN